MLCHYERNAELKLRDAEVNGFHDRIVEHMPASVLHHERIEAFKVRDADVSSFHHPILEHMPDSAFDAKLVFPSRCRAT